MASADVKLQEKKKRKRPPRQKEAWEERRQTEKGSLKSCKVCLKAFSTTVLSMWKGDQESDSSEAEEGSILTGDTDDSTSVWLEQEKEKVEEGPPPQSEGYHVQNVAEPNPPRLSGLVLENADVPDGEAHQQGYSLEDFLTEEKFGHFSFPDQVSV